MKNTTVEVGLHRNRYNIKVNLTKLLEVPADATIAEICQIAHDRFECYDTKVDYVQVPRRDNVPSTDIDRKEYKSCLAQQDDACARPRTPPPEYEEIDSLAARGSDHSSSSVASTQYYPTSIVNDDRRRVHAGSVASRADGQDNRQAVWPWRPDLAPIDETRPTTQREYTMPTTHSSSDTYRAMSSRRTNGTFYEEWSSHKTTRSVREYRYHMGRNRRG